MISPRGLWRRASSAEPVEPIETGSAEPLEPPPALVNEPGPAAEPVLDLDAAEHAAEPAVAGENGHGKANGTEEAARATQDRALEELEAQFADLVQRVDRLGSGHDPS